MLGDIAPGRRNAYLVSLIRPVGVSVQRIFDAVGVLQQVGRPEQWLVYQARPIDQGILFIAWDLGHRPILAQASDPS
jgi:hypothetical protein